MRIKLGIGMRMVQAVQNGVRTGTQVRRALHNVGKNVKEALPAFTHFKSTMSGVAVLEECLAKKREVPNTYEKQYHHHHRAQRS